MSLTFMHEARKVFTEKLMGTMETIAKDMKIQVAFDPEKVVQYRLLGYENRALEDKDFRNDAVDAGEIMGTSADWHIGATALEFLDITAPTSTWIPSWLISF